MWSLSGLDSPPGRIRQKNLKNSECKISRIWSERSFLDISGSSWRGRQTNQLCGYLLLVSEPSQGSSGAVLRSYLARRKCQMTKLKQFSDDFDLLYSRKNSPWIGRVRCLTSSGELFLRDFRQEWVLGNVRRGNISGQKDGSFLTGLAGSVFYGKVRCLKLR